MKILITADIHCGIPGKIDDCIWAMRTMREYAKKNDISVVVVLGDLFHNRVDINIMVLMKVSEFLDEAKFEYNQDWIIFPGNHDMFMRHNWDVNSLRSFKRIVTLIDDVALIKIYGKKFRIIPFVQHEDVYMDILDRVNNMASDDEILLTHIGTTGAKYNSCFLMRHWGHVNFDNTKFKKVFAGHFHIHQEFKNIYIPGSPIPFRHDEGMVDHGFFVYDLDQDDVEFVNIDIGMELIGGNKPQEFWTISDDKIDDIKDFSNMNVRIMLNDNTKSRVELDEIKNRILDGGAVKVSFMKLKEKDDESDKKLGDHSGTLDPIKLFEEFIGRDRPDLDLNLLTALNKKIIDESFDKVQALNEDEID